MATDKNDSRWALGILAGSGAAVLGHEVLWTRRLTDLIGASAEANARVFGCFFLGLALGAAAAARVLPEIRRPWRTAGWIELGAALLCLPILALPIWSGWLWPWVGAERLAGWPGAVLKWGLSFLAIVPPAGLMGMTLPLVTSAVCGRGRGSAKDGVSLYAAYTAGGAVGVALVVGVALHALGVAGAITLTLGLNVTVAALCFRRNTGWRGEQAGGPPEAGAPPSVGDPGEERLRLGLGFMSGAGIMALEVLGLAMLNLKVPLAFYPPAAVLFCVVILLTAAASVAPRLAERLGGPDRALAACLASAGLALAVAPLIFMGMTAGHTQILGQGRGLAESLLRLGGVTFLALGPGVLLGGFVFPLLLGGSGSSGSNSVGRELGRLLAVNGLGGVLGAEAAYRLVLPSAGVHIALGGVGACYGLTALAVLAATRQPVRRWAWPAAAVGGIAVLLAGVLPKLPLFLRGETFHVIEVRSGREGSLAVVQRADLGRGMFFDNQYLLGSSGATPDMHREAHVPLLLHPSPKRVGFIGLGTGITAAGALRHRAVESITIVELSGLVARAAIRHFQDFNQGICVHPRATVLVEDARPYLAASPGRFDVVIGDLFTPWQPGEAGLCSLEQFEAARASLQPDGLFCQWMPVSQLTEDQFDAIATTFRRVFPKVHLFRLHFRAKSLAVAMVGWKHRGLDWEVIARRCEAERQAGGMLDPVCRHPEGLALLYLGTLASADDVPGHLNTLNNLWVELNAGRQILIGDPNNYFHGMDERWQRLLRRQVRALEQVTDLPAPWRRLPSVGLLASRLETAVWMNDPSATALEQELWEAIPPSVRTDSAADWTLWPGSKKGPPTGSPPLERQHQEPGRQQ